jgi:cation diffusion facilitator CzcD-associated flavoprotein CzcO
MRISKSSDDKDSSSQQLEQNASNENSIKRVAIIGGGVSGILAIKACKEENIFDEIVCFEKTSQSAGLWRYR